ncbi:MAG: choice-of-anchor D domain-containing protein [Myxococcota bacterium]
MARTHATLGIVLALVGCQDAVLNRLGATLIAPEEVDLGRLAPGLVREVVVPLQNQAPAGEASSALRITDVRIEPAQEGLSVTEAPSALVAGGSGEIRLRFAPLELGSRETRLILDCDSEQTPTVSVRLSGEVDRDALVVSSPLDFGAVRLGDARVLALEVTNHVSVDVDLRVPVDGRGVPLINGEGFSVAPTGTGDLDADGRWSRLGPGETASLPLRFAPVADGSFEGQFAVEACESALCRRSVALLGEGVQTALRCEPSPLDFGSVRPGGSRSVVLTCENPTHRSLNLVRSEVVGDAAPRFSMGPPEGTLEAGRSIALPIEVRPLSQDRGRALRPSALVEAQAPNGPFEQVFVPLQVQVARAELQVLPARLAFGRVPVGLDVVRQVVLVNAGDRPVTIAEARVSGVPFSGGVVRRVLSPGAALAVPVTVRPSAEGDLNASLYIDVDDPEISDVTVPLEATALLLPPCRVNATPGQLSFGFVGLGETRRRAVAVTNVAPYDCLLRELRVEGDDFSVVPLEGADAFLGPGQRILLEVDASPTASGEHRGQLSFLVSDPTQPMRRVDLSVLSGVGALRLDPDRVDFGALPPGCESAPRSIWIRNLGTAPVGLASLRIDPGPFVLSAPSGLPGPTGPVTTLGGGQSVALSVRYAPTEVEVANPRLLTVQRDGPGELVTAELLGASTQGTVTDRHRQGPAGAVDVLFVLDNSLSMEREQGHVIANAGRFLEVLETAGADYQLAVVSTDMEGSANAACPQTGTRPAGLAEGACGFFSEGDATDAQASWRIVDAADLPSPRAAFARVANLGLGGSARESGLLAAATALAGPPARGHNLGFVRPDAHLALIFISDEEDQSSLDVDGFAARLVALRGTAALERTTVSAVVTTGAACGLDTGLRYQALADRFGGLVASICTPDWSDLVVDLAERALGLRSRFPLRSDPAPGSLEVRVDGQLVPEVVGPTQRRLWTLLAEDRAVVFEPEAIPPDGVEVTLSYRPTCP